MLDQPFHVNKNKVSALLTKFGVGSLEICLSLSCWAQARVSSQNKRYDKEGKWWNASSRTGNVLMITSFTWKEVA